MNKEVGRKRVLLVDDEAPVREAVGWVLTSLGVEVGNAANGAQALEKLSLAHFDLVITDYNMPGMRGDELAREIKRINPNQWVVMLTAFSREVLFHGKPPAEIDYLIEKPCSRSDLARAFPWG